MASKFELRIEEQAQISKVNRIVRTVEKVQAKLESFKLWADVNFHSVFNNLTEEQKDNARAHMDSFSWNNWHDLEDRLTDRYHDEVSKLQSIRFQLNGFIAI